MMAFLKVLVIYGEWFAQPTYLVMRPCLFKTSKKTFSNGAYCSTDSAESQFWRSRLKLFSLKSLKFLYISFLAFAFEKYNLYRKNQFMKLW